MNTSETGSSQLTGVISIHVFAITLVSADEPVTADAPVLDIQNVRSTTKYVAVVQRY